MPEVSYRIDIDTGGTFTDGVLTTAEGKVTGNKALTTPSNLSDGVMNLITKFAETEKIPIQDLLGKTKLVRYGSTQATNLLIEKKGPKLGMITTRGFEDTLRIMRAVGRVDGLSEKEFKHLAKARRPEVLIPRNLIVGVTERVDCKGNVVIPLNDEEVKLQLENLLREDVEAIVICLLWGFKANHEQRIKEIIETNYPDLVSKLTLSSEISPKFRELPRMNTTVINAYRKRDVEKSIHVMKDE